MNPQQPGAPSASTTGGGMKLSFSMKPVGLAGAPAAKKPLPFGADDDDEDAETALPTTVGGVHRPVKRPRVVAPSRPAPPPPSATVASGAPVPAPSASSTHSFSSSAPSASAAPTPSPSPSLAPQRATAAPAPSPPAPPAERKEVIDKLAQYVARHGPDFEQLTRSRNEGNPKFGFLFDSAASASEETRMERAYYIWLLDEERKKVAAAAGKGPMPFTSISGSSAHSASSAAPPWRKQTSAPSPTPAYHPHPSSLPQSPPSSTRKRQFDEVGGQKRFSEDGPRATSPPAASGDYRSTPLPGSSYDANDVLPQQPQHGKPGGHHIGDFLPKEELEKFLPKRAGSSAPAPTPTPPPPTVDSDIGKKLLQKMGWKEGTGLGSAGDGITEPIKAQVKNDKLGVGTADPSTIGESDDIYEAYKKRMMTAYRYRPNPLNNPRRQYY